jgi:hypothetical protein
LRESVPVGVERRGGEPKRDTYGFKCKQSELCSGLRKIPNFRYHVLGARTWWCMSSGDGVVVDFMESEVRTICVFFSLDRINVVHSKCKTN